METSRGNGCSVAHRPVLIKLVLAVDMSLHIRHLQQLRQQQQARVRLWGGVAAAAEEEGRARRRQLNKQPPARHAGTTHLLADVVAHAPALGRKAKGVDAIVVLADVLWRLTVREGGMA